MQVIISGLSEVQFEDIIKAVQEWKLEIGVFSNWTKEEVISPIERRSDVLLEGNKYDLLKIIPGLTKVKNGSRVDYLHIPGPVP